MQDIERFLELRKRQYQEEENRAYYDASDRVFLSNEPDREEMEDGSRRADEEQAVNHALIGLIDEILDKFF